jgi:hypothetical protein
MRIALAVVLIVHGFAHLSGFLIPWRIETLNDMPYKTTILANSVDVGDRGIRVVGLLWLIGAVAFAVCGIFVLIWASYWWPVTLVVTVFSFFLCILEWPESRIGGFVNVGLAALLLAGRHGGWL